MTDEVQEEQENGGGLKRFASKVLPYILILALGVGGGIYTTQQKPEWFGLSKGIAQAQAEVDALIAQVGKLIALPTDEKPTVATVTDIDKVKDQIFFKNAKNGDKVLIYTKAQKAILYNPTENKIVEVGAVNINNQTGQVSPDPLASPSATPNITK